LARWITHDDLRLMVTLEMVLDEPSYSHIYGARYQFSFLRAWIGVTESGEIEEVIKMHHVQTPNFEARFRVIFTLD
jgi:hypothetical protein